MKFRIFDKKQGIYTEEPFYRYLVANNGDLYNSDNGDWSKQDERYIIEYWTGLIDKNGKEIYVGDICWTYEIGIGNLKCDVVFDDGSFCFKHEHMLTTEIRGWKRDYMEVVDNIHPKIDDK